ncbi:hypothetical protein BDN72DRAFT_382278 [Pluteus cervinus]|uniref:Uncharacterized protein n=1 Tax=Pluteus cervinus TaxID=181527 RepID=A0ACD3AAF7_9AGAR|nr:hypothetical protein BDN72DRAFT_382278 [Pluteus cervinus]
MSGISSYFGGKFLPAATNTRDRTSPSGSGINSGATADPLSHLRFVLETLPGSRKYVFTPATRAEILSELYDAFWGPYAHLFLPNSNSSLPLHATLSEVQVSLGFSGAGKEEPVPGRPCGHIFKKGESCFRCKDCALDDSCVLCSRCFHATDHSDHNVSFFIAQQSGGCCDCGDAEAWRLTLACPLHPPINNPNDDPSFNPLPVPLSAKAAQKAVSDNVPPVSNYPYRISVPPDLRSAMHRTVGYALDFLLDTLDYSPDEPLVPENEADLRLQPSADPMMKDQYCVIVWNDDKHSYDELMRILGNLANRPREETFLIAHNLDENGREVVDMNTNVTRLLEVAKAITKIDLAVTIRRAYDTFREQIVGVIIEWLLDLTRSRIGTDTLMLREVLAAELMSPRKRENTQVSMQHILPDISSPTRLDVLFLYHTKLWKKPRLSMKEIYASVISLSKEHKIAVAGHYANVYHWVIDAYLLVDREAETSIKYFALQLFTVPSVALHIVTVHKLITRLLTIITAFFTNQIIDRHIVHQPSPNVPLDVDSFPFKSKRFMPVFSDLRYLCHTNPVQELIAHNREFLVGFVKTCQLFMCVNPNKRAATSHVEYETDAWISVFNVTLSLSRVIKVYGEAFSRATTAELVTAINTVVHHILMVCTRVDDRLDKSKFPPVEFHEVEFGTIPYQIIKFDVLDGWVSFHHSLHWLLAELFKHVELLNEEKLAEVGMTSLRDVLMKHASVQAVLTIIDFPLRVLAMIAQIRTGLWVRNGFAIRGQLLHYRDYMLRELCYDQDLFILQTSLIVLDPNTVLISILDRFSLMTYFSGTNTSSSPNAAFATPEIPHPHLLHPVYDANQLSSMVEEVLYVLITILSEPGNAGKISLPLSIRRELIHALAMGPCSFTDLVKRVSERLVEDVSFEKVLKSVSTFRPPEGTTEIGMYELKDEMYDEVNPFFYHYTKNRREEVENILMTRLRKRVQATGTGGYGKGNDPVIVPKPFGLTEGPYAIVPSIFESEVLMQIIFYAIYNVLLLTDPAGSPPPSGEAILDQALHLVMLGLVEREELLSQLSVVKTFEDQKTLVDVLCVLETHDKFKAYRGRTDWILGTIQRHVPDEVNHKRQPPGMTDASLSGDAAEDAKKKAAKARKEAIMQQMKAQQASFAINFDSGEDGLDGDEDEEMEDAEGEGAEEHLSYGTCIVCQEDLNASRPFGMLGLVQPSRLIRRHPDTQHTYLNDVLHMPLSMDRSPPPSSSSSTSLNSSPGNQFPPLNADALDAKALASPNFEGFPSAYTRFGLHASVCSHMMHKDCFQSYTASIRQRHRTQATRNHPESIPRKEYICPLCKSLGNVVLPVAPPSTVPLSTVPFPDWIRAAGINILKSKPDHQLEVLQMRTGTGEFAFWSAQDPGYANAVRSLEKWESMETIKMLDTVISVSRSFSQQTRHLRDRPEPDVGERGAGLYLPEELVGYTLAGIEIAQRGIDASAADGAGGSGSTGNALLVDNIPEAQYRMIRGLLTCLTRWAGMHFQQRPDEGRDAIRLAIIKRLLPEWSRSSLTSFSYPLLLRDPLTILIEAAAVAPDMLNHVLVLTYYACLARTVIGLVYILNKTRAHNVAPVTQRAHQDLFGNIRTFFISIVRHSPVFESTATAILDSFGEARVEKLLYALTLPFLRRAAILCRAVVPSAFPTVSQSTHISEYARLLQFLRIPPLADISKHDILQNALSSWSAHYGHSQASTQINCGITLDYPTVYRLARLPLVLDTLFGPQDKALVCPRCDTVPNDAAICLICGITCCMQSHCCNDVDYGERGECNMHTRECGGTVGLYFLVKRSALLYINSGNGSFAPSPYLDAHGEVDMSMRRGRRQFLHQPRWEEVRKIWLTHGIPTVIARKLESTMDAGGWETL